MEPTLPPERLLTAAETAAHLGISPGQLLTWTRNGLVPVVRLESGAVRYCPDEVNAWLRSKATGAE